ncbi:MAG TPA: thioesterase domain-containing protein [Thermoanaerobaculia bacterium]|nr:thioesterase domain-containing protein [Thermoanaerobaculia bacterium]
MGASGAIEFLGRTDTQVKLRGFRIELEEIETALRRHAGVLDAAVLATERNGETTLVAFVRGDFDVDPLRATVRALLPEAMVPGEIVKMDKFPLNANGKVDRKALRVPVLRANDSDAVAPATTTEVALTELWERVLGQRGIGVTTDFFDAGGHSLKVARLVSLIQNDMNVHVPLTVVFRAPTVRELASYIDDARRFDLRLVDDVLVKMNRVDGAPAVFAFPPGSGYCLAYLRLAELLPVPFYGFGFIDDDQRLDEYVRRIVETAPAPYTLFGYSSGGKLAFRVAQELESRGHDVANVVILDSARYLRTVQFNDADIREIAAELLESVTSRVLREKTLARMRRYRAYIGELVESGTIAADLHLITAHDSREIPGVATLDGWRALTTGAFQRIEGSGAHREMLQPPHVETNAALLRAIFTPVLTEA